MDKEIFEEEKINLKQTIEKLKKERLILNSETNNKNSTYSKSDYITAYLKYVREKRIKDIDMSINKPYFARIDFKEENKELEKLYIGKLSILESETQDPIVIDWRAPIANLYYDGRIGENTYKALGKEIKGDISLKRQYFIEQQTLEKYVDIDLTTNDALLQTAISQNADDRLKNIVATIQDEQNKIIRADINKPLIVQGVAGSGKTTIALHRIAYLIYNYDKDFKAEEFMIIAPNKFFLNYISNVLPDLGVDQVKQCTFEDFAYDVIGKKLKISDSNEKLVTIVNKEIANLDSETMIKESKFKSSIAFQKYIDRYLREIELSYIPKENFVVHNFNIMGYKQIQELFLNTYKLRDFDSRINEVKKHILNKLISKKEYIAEEIREQRRNRIKLLEKNNNIEDVAKIRIEIFEEYEELLKKIESKPKLLVDEYLKTKKYDCVKLYTEFIEKYIELYFEEKNSLLRYLKENTLKNLQKKEISFEDIAPIVYIHYKVHGIKAKNYFKHVVIDEAQDYGEFQFTVLKTILNSNSMTILGDIAQGVHFYRGVENWEKFIDVVFENIDVTYTTLKKTYRTTREIMEIANKVIDNLAEYEKDNIVLGEPIINSENAVNIIEFSSKEEIIKNINIKIDSYLKDGFKSIAIIGKSIEECKYIEVELKKYRKDVKLIHSKDSEYNYGVSVVPSYLAKGLEFDCVILFDVNSRNYQNNSLDIKLLYVAITRAMSKLDICYVGIKSELLK